MHLTPRRPPGARRWTAPVILDTPGRFARRGRPSEVRPHRPPQAPQGAFTFGLRAPLGRGDATGVVLVSTPAKSISLRPKEHPSFSPARQRTYYKRFAAAGTPASHRLAASTTRPLQHLPLGPRHFDSDAPRYNPPGSSARAKRRPTGCCPSGRRADRVYQTRTSRGPTAPRNPKLGSWTSRRLWAKPSSAPLAEHGCCTAPDGAGPSPRRPTVTPYRWRVNWQAIWDSSAWSGCQRMAPRYLSPAACRSLLDDPVGTGGAPVLPAGGQTPPRR